MYNLFTQNPVFTGISEKGITMKMLPGMSRWIVIGMFMFSSWLIGNVMAQSESSWPYENETKEQRDARMKWWREARFGMFIHWGVYSVPAGTYDGKEIPGIGEWIMNRGKIPVARYKKYASEFNPVNYDPDAWVRLAKEAGMKYIVITSKHHDGFALFDSKVTDWDVVDATPYGKDLLKPLAEACRKHGIKLGFYYSQAQDWCHPGGAASGGHWDPAQDGDMTEYIRKIAVPQVKEILTNYGDLAVLWWDTPTNMTRERADMLQPLITLQPGIITNNRLGGGYRGDTETPEQHIPATGYKDRDWETCMTMNGTWGFKSYDHNWKSTTTLLRNLVDIASKGGNYLLNVGPTSLGEIPQPSIDRLKEVGQWMKVNGESIYDTSATPFAKLAWGRCTKKVEGNSTTLYLHVFEWPEDGELVVPGLNLKKASARAYMLANGKVVKLTSNDDCAVLKVGKKAIDPIDTVVVLKVTGPYDIVKMLPIQSSSGILMLSPELAEIHNPAGAEAQVESKGDKPNIGFWTNSQAWLEWSFKINKPGQYIVETEIAMQNGKSQFELSYGEQKIVVDVASTGSYDTFKPVTLGKIDLTAGDGKLVIKPVRDQWSPINLRAIVLKPAQ